MKNILRLGILLSCISVMSQTKKLAVESNHSTIGFNISIAGFTRVTGKFTDYSIAMDWNDKALDSCRISGVVRVASINTGIPDRDAHLRTADFFDVEKYPEIIFESDSIIQVNYSNFKAHGKLSMHGISRDFILPFQIVKVENNTLGIRSRSTLNRLDYGIGADFKHSSMPNFLSDKIELELDFWTKKRKE